MQKRLDQVLRAMALRRKAIEQPFDTIKAWMGAAHFPTRTVERVSTEMSLQVMAYNMKRVIAISGAGPLMEAIKFESLIYPGCERAIMGSLGP